MDHNCPNKTKIGKSVENVNFGLTNHKIKFQQTTYLWQQN